ncbi:MAG: beta-glucosidase [Sinobacteraceae bacterium]|nr:beta-glucosidase [Nevskiaceae bacterium]
MNESVTRKRRAALFMTVLVRCVNGGRGALLCGLLLAAPAFAQAPPQLRTHSIAEIIAAMTAEEKVGLVVGTGMPIEGLPLPPEMQGPGTGDVSARVLGASGMSMAIPRLGIPSVVFADGPAGVRIAPRRPNDARTYHATAFPSATLLASSWDTALIERVGAAMGEEAREYGIDVLLAPAMNLHRNPLGGRNFEYYSEDPLLSGRLAAAAVRGIQSQGVGATPKHFVANDHEWNRYTLDVQVSAPALHELYLRPFEIVVREAQPWALMSSYNKLNGRFTSESPALLTDLLQRQWGFRGLVMTDWYAGTNPLAQMQAGNHLLMPGTGVQHAALSKALRERRLDVATLDRNVAAILELVRRTPVFRGHVPSNTPDLAGHAALAREAAAAGAVLLENREALPLADTARVALFGNAAYDTVIGGSGSGDVYRAYSISIAQGLQAAGVALNATLTEGYARFIADERARQPPRQALAPRKPIAERSADLPEISTVAAEADVAIVVIGRDAGEFADRRLTDDFLLRPVERTLLESVTREFRARGKKTIVILNIGAVIETASWRALPDAILLCGLPGQEAGYAIADVLTGKVAPSGRLSTTFPVRWEDVPSSANFPGKTLLGPDPAARGLLASVDRAAEVSYDDGLWVGYRHFATRNAPVVYPFGHGLSYTTFRYSDLVVSAPQADGSVAVQLKLTNTGKTAAREVVQLYLTTPNAARPRLELRGFTKTGVIAAGEAVTVRFALQARDFATFDESTLTWRVEPGQYTVQVGASAADLRQRASVRHRGGR